MYEQKKKQKDRLTYKKPITGKLTSGSIRIIHKQVDLKVKTKDL